MANFKAIMRLFGKFDQATTAEVLGRLYRWFFGNLHIDHLTLDLDSAVMTRYGGHVATIHANRGGILTIH
jgi:hypothetical protein